MPAAEERDAFGLAPLGDLVAQALQRVERLVDVRADRRRRLDQALEQLVLESLVRLGDERLRPRARARATRRRRGQLLLDAERQRVDRHRLRGRSAANESTDAVDGAAGRLPGVVRGARAELPLVRDDPRVAPHVLRALRVPEQVRVVALLPDEDQVRGGHELGDEAAVRRRAGEPVGPHAEPARVVGRLVEPELVLDVVGQHPRAPSRRRSVLGLHASTIRTCTRPRRGPRALGRRDERDAARDRFSPADPRKRPLAAGRVGLRNLGRRARGRDGRARPARRPGAVLPRPRAGRDVPAEPALAAAAHRPARLHAAGDDRRAAGRPTPSSRPHSPRLRSSSSSA